MADEIKPQKIFLRNHIAVRWEDTIVVMNSNNRRTIWIYNLWTEHWRGYRLPRGFLPVESGQQGVHIGSNIYMFGGIHACMWKLEIGRNDSFVRDLILIENKPSARERHSVWKYDEKMWIFGGYGRPIDFYDIYNKKHELNKHGKFTGGTIGSSGFNNQLLYFDPFSETWTNVACCGDVPAPRSDAASAVINDKVYLHGGSSSVSYGKEMYELDMQSITWTRIKATGLTPNVQCKSSLIPVSAKQLVFFGGSGRQGGTKIFDVQSQMWNKHLWRNIGYQSDHTATLGLHGSAIILGEEIQPKHQAYNPVFTVRFEPKSLQQLAMTIIYQEVDSTLWKMLPEKLTHKLMGGTE